MKPRALIVCLTLGAIFALLPGVSQAQGRRYGRSGVVMGPDGPLYNTRSPEWRMSGGNIFVYQELMAQKMMLQQQRMLMRQEQMLMKQSQRNQSKAGAAATAPRSRKKPARNANANPAATGRKSKDEAGKVSDPLP